MQKVTFTSNSLGEQRHRSERHDSAKVFSLSLFMVRMLNARIGCNFLSIHLHSLYANLYIPLPAITLPFIFAFMHYVHSSVQRSSMYTMHYETFISTCFECSFCWYMCLSFHSFSFITSTEINLSNYSNIVCWLFIECVDRIRLTAKSFAL